MGSAWLWACYAASILNAGCISDCWRRKGRQEVSGSTAPYCNIDVSSTSRLTVSSVDDHVMASELMDEEPVPQPALPEELSLDEQSEVLNGAAEVPFAIDLGVMQATCASTGDQSTDSDENDQTTLEDRNTGCMERESLAGETECESGCKSDSIPGEEASTDETSTETATPVAELQAQPPALPQLRDFSRHTRGRWSTALHQVRRLFQGSLNLDSDDPAFQHNDQTTNDEFLSTLNLDSDDPVSQDDGQITLDDILTAGGVKDEADIDESWEEATSQQSQPIVKSTECSSCFEVPSDEDILELSCPSEDDIKHAYCRTCLRSMFEAATTDSSLFPPRCCDPLQLSDCRPFLSKDLITKFEEKKEELETPNRVYCSKAKCSKWIKPVNIRAGVATCAECSRKTCTSCKTRRHRGLCPDDKDVKALLALAEEKGWKSCPECKNLVELDVGCYHMVYVYP
jgi:hypothetical protein